METVVEARIFEEFAVSTFYRTSDNRRVELKEQIGKGAYGKVFKAICEGKNIAVKVIKVRHNDHKAHILKEISELQRFDSSGFTPRFFGSSEFADCFAMEMELLGPSLFEINNSTTERAFAASDVLCYAEQLLEALAHIHSEGLTHCDLKTQNICTAEDDRNRIVMIDFGQCLKTSILSRFPPGAALVTLPYESPEAIFGMSLSTKVDIWSVGVCLGELMTGRLVFRPHSKGHLTRDLCSANLVPAAALETQIYKTLAVVPPEGYRTPAPFSNLKDHFTKNTTGEGWTEEKKTKFIDLVCRLMTPDAEHRPSSDEALKLFKEGNFKA